MKPQVTSWLMDAKLRCIKLCLSVTPCVNYVSVKRNLVSESEFKHAASICRAMICTSCWSLVTSCRTRSNRAGTSVTADTTDLAISPAVCLLNELPQRTVTRTNTISNNKVVFLPVPVGLSTNRILSLRFNGHFQVKPALAGVYWSKGWWKWWWQLEL